MSVLAPMLRKQQVFAFKSEATTGTEEAGIGAADGTTICYDTEIEQDEEFSIRQGQSSLDPHEGTVGAQVAGVKFTTDLPGSGTAATAPSYEAALLASGLSVAVAATRIYTPVTGSASMTSLTVAKYIDGLKRIARGVTLNWTLRGATDKQAVMEWEGKGAYVDPTATALIAPTYVISPIPPRLQNMTFTIGGTSYIIRAFTFTPGNVISVRRNLASLVGVHSTAIVNRKAELTVDVEASSAKLWTADYTAGALAAVSIVMGTTTGNQWTLAIPKGQLCGPPQSVDIDGVEGLSLKFQCVRNTVAGDDSFSLTHG